MPPPITVVPLAVAPESISSKPPLMVVPLAVPSTYSPPALKIVADRVVPPANTASTPALD
jgi:hypothetical protein